MRPKGQGDTIVKCGYAGRYDCLGFQLTLQSSSSTHIFNHV